MFDRCKYSNVLLALALSNALDNILEFQSPENIGPLLDMVSGGHFELEPGQLPDDMSIARGRGRLNR